MYLELKDPYKTLPRYGYQMIGTSNQFRRHTSFNVWFHAIVQHDNQGIKIHQDYSKAERDFYKNHKTNQKSEYLAWETERLKEFEEFEPKWWEFWKNN